MPAPPVGKEVDLKDFPYTPIYRARLFGSAFHARATDSEWRAGVTLWLRSQDQVPAGSLPDDDMELCRLAELGRDVKTWRKLRAGALHGWIKCDDGRLYNMVVAQVVNEQWQSKVAQRHRTLKARIAALEKRLSQTQRADVADDIRGQLQTLRLTLSQNQSQEDDMPAADAVTAAVAVSVTETKRREEKGREGNKIDSSRRQSATPPAGGNPIDDDDLIRKLRVAGAGNIDEAILTPLGVAPIRALIDEGFDLDRHILPAISDVCCHLKRPPLHSFSAGFLRPKIEAQRAEAERREKAKIDLANKVFVEHGTAAWAAAERRRKAAGKRMPTPIKSEQNQGRMGWYFDAEEAA